MIPNEEMTAQETEVTSEPLPVLEDLESLFEQEENQADEQETASMQEEQMSPAEPIAEISLNEEEAGKVEASVEEISVASECIPQEMPNVEQRLEQLDQKMDYLQALNGRIEELNGHVQQMKVGMSHLNQTIKMHETIEANMNRELNQYKSDYYATSLKPILTDLCKLHNDISDVYSLYFEELEKGRADVKDDRVSTLKFYKKTLESVLKRYQVKVQPVEENAEPDPNDHQVVGIVETEDEALVGKVADSKGNIYIYNNKTVLMPAMVRLYKLK